MKAQGDDEMEIGTKLKNARAKSGLTQEKVAEEIGVTRQSMSNWENGRSYPDIVSVIKLSDLYSVSLDELLKEDNKMIEHLDDSTNIVKSRKRLTRFIMAGAYLLIWTAAVFAVSCRIGNNRRSAARGKGVYCGVCHRCALSGSAAGIGDIVGDDRIYDGALEKVDIHCGFRRDGSGGAAVHHRSGI